jgi:hypothetical protein
MPVASMPRMRGNGHMFWGVWPCRVKCLDRFSPNTFTRMRTSPTFGTGMRRCSSLRISGPPALCIATAFMVDMIILIVFNVCLRLG